MKASRLLMLLPALTAVLLTACAQDNNDEPVSDKGLIREKTKITFWNTFSYNTQIENVIREFKKIEPNVTVENKKQSGSYSDLKEMTVKGIPANNYPNIVAAYPDHVAEYLELNNVVIDMNPYVNNKDYGWTEEDMEDIVPEFLEEGTMYPEKGKLYSLPMAKSTEAMYYNTKILGVDLSKIDATINDGKAISKEYINSLTWEELFDKLAPALIEYNKTLTGTNKIYEYKENDPHGILGYDSDDNLFITLAYQYGIPYTSLDEYGEAKIEFNNPEMKALVKKLGGWAEKEYLVTKGSADGKHPNDFFKKKGCIFSIGSTGGVKYQVSDKFDVGVAPIPHAGTENGKNISINQGPSVCFLSHGNKNQDLASWLFYKFMTETKNNSDWAVATGYMPIRYSVSQSDNYKAFANPTGKADSSEEKLKALNATFAADALDNLFSTPIFKGSATARDEVSNIIARVVKEKQTDEAKIAEYFKAAADETALAL